MDGKLTFDAAIFDIGNVLLRFDFASAFKKLGAPGVELLGGMSEWQQLKIDYETGLLERAAFVADAIRMIGFTGHASDFMKIWQDIFTLNEPMWEIVHVLHARIPLYLLSNTNDLHVEVFTTQFAGFGRFKDAIYSHEVKVMKPNPAIFALAIQRFGVDPASTLYIDDLPENVEAARKAGFIALEYHHDRHSDLLKELSRRGFQSNQ